MLPYRLVSGQTELRYPITTLDGVTTQNVAQEYRCVNFKLFTASQLDGSLQCSQQPATNPTPVPRSFCPPPPYPQLLYNPPPHAFRIARRDHQRIWGTVKCNISLVSIWQCDPTVQTRMRTNLPLFEPVQFKTVCWSNPKPNSTSGAATCITFPSHTPQQHVSHTTEYHTSKLQHHTHSD
jgi:hypothetical protein